MDLFTRSGDLIRGARVTRRPATRVALYEAVLASDGTIERLTIDYRTPPENPEGARPQRLVVTMHGDSAMMEREGPARADTMWLAVPAEVLPSFPVTLLPVAFIEQAVRQALASGEDPYAFSVLGAGQMRLGRNAITQRAADTVAFDFFGNPMLAAVDSTGHVLGVTGRLTTWQAEIERVDAGGVDLGRLAADFAARDARGEGIGDPSPGATVTASVGGANVEVAYSRPAKRGRVIFGGLVPWEAVWRTGANAATVFTTDRDLEIGGTPLPAGSYTLWSTFTPERGTLIVNGQTGQWGTQYDEAQDVMRVPLEHRTLQEPVERFTITVEETADGGVLALMWDVSEYRVVIGVP